MINLLQEAGNLITLCLKNVFRGKVKMFCFVAETKSEYVYAGRNVSAAFLCPDFTPICASFEEQLPISAYFHSLLSGDTPADVLPEKNFAEYQIVSESVNCSFSVALPLAADNELIDCNSENVYSGEIITISNALAEDSSSMFLVEKHIPSNFYITVCNDEYCLYSREYCSFEYRKYCAASGGFSPHGMELKIKVQNFKL